MQDKGIRNPAHWLEVRGFSRSRANQLLKGEAKEIKVAQVAVLCRYLRCQPSDLFAWKEDDEPLEPGHPLLQLEPYVLAPGLSEQIPTLHPDELREVKQLVEALKRKRKER